MDSGTIIIATLILLGITLIFFILKHNRKKQREIEDAVAYRNQYKKDLKEKNNNSSDAQSYDRCSVFILPDEEHNDNNLPIGQRYIDSFYRVHCPHNYFMEVEEDVNHSFVALGIKKGQDYSYSDAQEIAAVRCIDSEITDKIFFNINAESSRNVALQKIINFIGDSPVVVNRAYATFQFIYQYHPRVKSRIREIDINEFAESILKDKDELWKQWDNIIHTDCNLDNTATVNAISCAELFLKVKSSEAYAKTKLNTMKEVEAYRLELEEKRESDITKREKRRAKKDFDIACIKVFRSIVINFGFDTAHIGYGIMSNGFINFTYYDIPVFKVKNSTNSCYALINIQSEWYIKNKNIYVFNPATASDGENNIRLPLTSAEQLTICSDYIKDLFATAEREEQQIEIYNKKYDIYKQNFNSQLMEYHKVSKYISIDEL